MYRYRDAECKCQEPTQQGLLARFQSQLHVCAVMGSRQGAWHSSHSCACMCVPWWGAGRARDFPVTAVHACVWRDGEQSGCVTFQSQLCMHMRAMMRSIYIIKYILYIYPNIILLYKSIISICIYICNINILIYIFIYYMLHNIICIYNIYIILYTRII